MDVLLILDGKVENCICADSVERAQQFYPDHLCIERLEGQGVGPGWGYVGGAFVAPPPPAPAPKQPITRLAFLRRFPAEARIAIRAAATTDPVLADAMSLLDLAEDVLTDDPDTLRLIGYCQQQGLLTAAQAAVILE